jgi:hypothetical protein
MSMILYEFKSIQNLAAQFFQRGVIGDFNMPITAFTGRY